MYSLYYLQKSLCHSCQTSNNNAARHPTSPSLTRALGWSCVAHRSRPLLLLVHPSNLSQPSRTLDPLHWPPRFHSPGLLHRNIISCILPLRYLHNCSTKTPYLSWPSCLIIDNLSVLYSLTQAETFCGTGYSVQPVPLFCSRTVATAKKSCECNCHCSKQSEQP